MVPGAPHHVVQRGNRRMKTFFSDEDYEAYLSLLAEWCGRYDVEVLAYCLMPNHVHLILVPPSKDGLCRAIGEAHRPSAGESGAREESGGAARPLPPSQ